MAYLRHLLRCYLIGYCFLVSLVLPSCTQNSVEHGAEIDSAELDERDYAILKDPKRFSVRADLMTRNVNLMGKETALRSVLEKLYFPDTAIAGGSDSTAADYMVMTTEFIRDRFFLSEDLCEDRSIVMCMRGDYVDEEFYDVFFLATDRDGNLKVADHIEYEGSQGQVSTEVRLEKTGLAVNKNCNVLKVSSRSEGGEDTLVRDEWVEFLIADGKGFRSLLKIQLEETRIQETESSDGTQITSSKIQRYEILKSSGNGLADIRISFRHDENGKTVAIGERVYSFDGRFYVERQ